MSAGPQLHSSDFAFNQTETKSRAYEVAERAGSGLLFRAGATAVFVSALAFIRNWLQPASGQGVSAATFDGGDLQLAATAPVADLEAAPEVVEAGESEDTDAPKPGSSVPPEFLFHYPVSASLPTPLSRPLSRLKGGQNDNDRAEPVYASWDGGDTISFRPGALLPGSNGQQGNAGGTSSGNSGGGNGPGGGSEEDDEPAGGEDGKPRSNSAPVVSGPVMLGSLGMSSAMSIGLLQLLQHARDEDGDVLHVQNMVVSAGRLSLLPNDAWLFVAGREEPSVVTFSYDISDGTSSVSQQAILNLIPAPGMPATASGSGYIVGTPQSDDLVGTPQADVIEGLAGGDVIIAREGNDVIFGGEGNDRIVAGDGDDVVLAGGGDDVVFGGAGNDLLLGEEGNDILMGEAGDDELHGGAGDDTLAGGEGSDALVAGAGDDVIVAEAGDGDDRIDGGEGSDTLVLATTSANAFVDLSAGIATSAESGTDTFLSIENVTGGAGDDTFVASQEQNIFVGGEGDDVFVFRTIESAGLGLRRDKILDFETGDRIDLDDIAKGLESMIEDAFAGAAVRRFLLLGAEQEFSAAGQMKYAHFTNDAGGASPYTLLMGNVDGSLDVDFEIEIQGHYNFTPDDFRGQA